MSREADDGVLRYDGEDGGATPWEFDSISNAGTATFALNADAALHGNQGYRVTGDGATTATYGLIDVIPGAGFYLRCYLRIMENAEGLTHGHIPQFIQLYADAWRAGVGARAWQGTPDTRLTQWRVEGSALSSAGSVTNWSTGVTHRVELRWIQHADGAGGMVVWIDGDEIFSQTDVNNDYAINKIRIGMNNAALASGHYVDFDDIKIATTGPIGEYTLSATPDFTKRTGVRIQF